VGHYGLFSIVDALKENTTLRKLALAGNKAETHVCKQIQESLCSNNGLREFDFSDNTIGDKGATEMSRAIVLSKSLTSLNLSKNDITEIGAKILGLVLEPGNGNSPMLKKLMLANNNIKDKGAKHIAKALEYNQVLSHLDLRGNNLRDESAKSFADALLKNGAMVSINLFENPIGINGVNSLLHAIEENPKSAMFDLKLNDIHKETIGNKMSALHQVREKLAKQAILSAVASLDRVHWSRSKLMVVGKEGSGKTTLVRSMTGEAIDPTSEATIGLEILSSVIVESSEDPSALSWKRKTKSTTDLDDIILPAGRVELKKKQGRMSANEYAEVRYGGNGDAESAGGSEIQNSLDDFALLYPPSTPSSNVGDTTEESSTSRTPVILNQSTIERPKREITLDTIGSALTENDLDRRYGDIVAEMYADDTESSADAPVQSFKIWEYAGNPAFHSVHHLFMTQMGIYLIVFDMTELLSEDENVLFEAKASLFNWIKMVRLHAPEAPVLLIGTKLDLVGDMDVLQINSIVEDELDAGSRAGFSLIENGELCFYPVDNITKFGVSAVQNAVEKCVVERSDVTKDIPLRWIACLDMMLSDKPRSYLRMEDVRGMAARCNINKDAEVQEMLGLFHQLGMIVHFGATGALRDIVTINPQWLTDNMCKLIPKGHNSSWQKTLKELKRVELLQEWQNLTETAVASRNLLDFFWVGNDADLMLEVLQQTMIICKWGFPKAGGEAQENDVNSQLYFVPSALQDVQVVSEEGNGELSRCKLDFSESFLPDGVFERLMCLCVAYSGMVHSTEKNSIPSPILGSSQAKIWLGPNLPIFLLANKNSSTISLMADSTNTNPGRCLDIVLSMLKKMNADVMSNNLNWKVIFQSTVPETLDKLFNRNEISEVEEFSSWIAQEGYDSSASHADTDIFVFLNQI